MRKLYARTLMIALAMTISATSFASTVINGIYYNLNAKTLEAKVTYKTNSLTARNDYKGAVNIPATVTYENKKYNVTAVSDSAFYFNTELTSITIPNSVKYVGIKAFMLCENLTSATLSNSMTRIENSLFYCCGSLTSINIPEGVTVISEMAFNGCEKLSAVILPSTLKLISPTSFLECPSLKSVTAQASVPINMYENTFETFGKLYVPEGSKEDYEKAVIWNNFTIIESTPTGISTISSNTDLTTQIYTLSGKKTQDPVKGVNIINGKKIIVR